MNTTHPPGALLRIAAPGLVLLTAMALLPDPAAGQADSHQTADGAGEHCSTPAEIAEKRSGAVVVGEPNEGFHGIRYGGTPVIRQGEGARWARAPVVREVYCWSPADSAGILPGDTIVEVNGVDAKEPRVLTPREPGMEFRLQVLRDGDMLEFTVTTVERPPTAVP